MGGDGPVPGTTADEVLIAIAAIALALTAIGAAWTKPPVLQVRRAMCWVGARLIGDPLGRWLSSWVTAAVTPTVERTVETKLAKALEPVRIQVGRLDKALREHMADEASTVVATHEEVRGMRGQLDAVSDAVTDLAGGSPGHRQGARPDPS